jgi:hypothetical protein
MCGGVVWAVWWEGGRTEVRGRKRKGGEGMAGMIAVVWIAGGAVRTLDLRTAVTLNRFALTHAREPRYVVVDLAEHDVEAQAKCGEIRRQLKSEKAKGETGKED